MLGFQASRREMKTLSEDHGEKHSMDPFYGSHFKVFQVNMKSTVDH